MPPVIPCWHHKCFYLGAIVTASVACCLCSDVMALSHYKHRKSTLTANPIGFCWPIHCSVCVHCLPVFSGMAKGCEIAYRMVVPTIASALSGVSISWEKMLHGEERSRNMTTNVGTCHLRRLMPSLSWILRMSSGLRSVTLTPNVCTNLVSHLMKALESKIIS